MGKTKKPRKPAIAIHGFYLDETIMSIRHIGFNCSWYYDNPKNLRAIGQWFIKAADWIEAQEEDGKNENRHRKS